MGSEMCIRDSSAPGDGIVFHIAGTRVAYEFFRSVRAGEAKGQLEPEILFPRHGAGLDYRDFTGKPTEDYVRTIGNRRVWVMLMNNGSAERPDPTTAMLTRVLAESFPRMVRWQFTNVEVRVYSREQVASLAGATKKLEPQRSQRKARRTRRKPIPRRLRVARMTYHGAGEYIGPSLRSG